MAQHRVIGALATGDVDRRRIAALVLRDGLLEDG
jgi:hypothetical protein